MNILMDNQTLAKRFNVLEGTEAVVTPSIAYTELGGRLGFQIEEARKDLMEHRLECRTLKQMRELKWWCKMGGAYIGAAHKYFVDQTGEIWFVREGEDEDEISEARNLGFMIK